MSSESELSYGLLFHLMEYWKREENYAKMAAKIRLESADVDDIETFVGLQHIKTEATYYQNGNLNNYRVHFSFPPQLHDPSLKNFAFLSSEGKFQQVSLIGEKNTPPEERLTNFDNGTICLGVKKERYEDKSEDSIDWENIRTLTNYPYRPPGAKLLAFLGGENARERIENKLEAGEISQEDAEEAKANLTPLQELNYEGFVEQFVTSPESKDVTFALLRRDLPTPPLPKSWVKERSTPDVDSLVEVASSLDNSYLAIQGPPGTGKTWTGAHIIHHLVTVKKKKVGITAQSWYAINNLLKKTLEHTTEKNGNPEELNAHINSKEYEIEGVKKSQGSTPEDFRLKESLLMASTTWFWAHADFSEEENKFDYLVIDEAGQLSLADTLAASKGAKNVILLGDPQQLPQVTQASHPKGEGFDAGASILEHILGKIDTFAESRERGVLLDTTYRLDPKICKFISEEFYDSELKSVYDRDSGSNHPPRRISDRENGLYWVPVQHDEGNPCVDENQKEAEEIAKIMFSLLKNSKFVNGGEERPISLKDFMVVAPYNRQRRTIRRTLMKELKIGEEEVDAIVGTVDKFQGKEAPIVLYSLTTSSHDHVPKGREDFLFLPNRLNVAISRAQCMAFLVGSEALIDAQAKSIPEMEALNHYCRYVDDLSSTWS